MEVASFVLGMAPLAASCMKTIQTIQDVRTKYEEIPIIMSAIATKCSTISVALSQLEYLDFSEASAAQVDGKVASLNHISQSIDAVIMGCTITLNMIEEYIIRAQEVTESSLNQEPTSDRVAKNKIIWNEDEVKELLQQLRAYQWNLSTLLTVIQSQSISQLLESNKEIRHLVVNQGTVIGALLNRTYASRQRMSSSALGSKNSSEKRDGTVSISNTNTSEKEFIFEHEVVDSAVYKRMESDLPTASRRYDTRSITDDISIASLASLNIIQVTQTPIESPGTSQSEATAVKPSQNLEPSFPIALDNFLDMSSIYERQYLRPNEVSTLTNSTAKTSQKPGPDGQSHTNNFKIPETETPSSMRYLGESERSETARSKTDPCETTTKTIRSANYEIDPRQTSSIVILEARNVLQNLPLVSYERTKKNLALETGNEVDFGGTEGDVAQHLAKSREVSQATISPHAIALPKAFNPTVPSLAQETPSSPGIKTAVVGDSVSGKTKFLISYTSNKFPTEYVPTVFDNYLVTVMMDDEPYTLGLYDTSGLEEYEKTRHLGYPQTDIFLICFSIFHPHSFENVRKQWAPEVHRHCPGVPFLLVGVRGINEDDESDEDLEEKLRRQNLAPIHKAAGRRMAKAIGAVKYMECNIFTQEGLKEIFEEALIAALEPPRKRPWYSWRRKK